MQQLQQHPTHPPIDWQSLFTMARFWYFCYPLYFLLFDGIGLALHHHRMTH